jgi:alkyl hydroperoxide reductase subunit AhpC
MIRIGQKIDDFAFDVYQGDEIREIKFSNCQGKWLVLLFYPIDFACIRIAELEEVVAYYDRFGKVGTQILAVCMDTAAAHRVRPGNAPSMNRIAFPIVPNRR